MISSFLIVCSPTFASGIVLFWKVENDKAHVTYSYVWFILAMSASSQPRDPLRMSWKSVHKGLHSSNTVLRFTNCRIIKRGKLLFEDIWILNGRIIDPVCVFASSILCSLGPIKMSTEFVTPLYPVNASLSKQLRFTRPIYYRAL